MPFPQYQDLKDALICLLYSDRNPNYRLCVSDVYEKLGDIFGLTDEERTILYSEYTKSKENRSYWETIIRSRRAELVKKNLILKPSESQRGYWQLSNLGRDVAFDMGTTDLYLKNLKSKYSDLRVKQHHAETLNDLDNLSEEPYVPEGKKLYKKHRILERNSKLIRQAKRIRLSEDPDLRCEACGFSFVEKYGEIGYGFIEAHHILPLSNLSGVKTLKVSDLALVCSNCHRMIHRAIQNNNSFISIDQFRSSFLNKE